MNGKPDIDDLLQEIFRHGYEFASEFPDEDISKVTDSCVAAHKHTIYSLLASEAVELEKWERWGGDGQAQGSAQIIKAIPISKLKAIMEIKES